MSNSVLDSEQRRTAFEYRKLGYSYEEIAVRMGCSLNLLQNTSGADSPELVRVVAEAVLAATPPAHGVQFVGSIDHPDRRHTACLDWLTPGRDTQAVYCNIDAEDGTVRVFCVPVHQRTSRSFDLSDPTCFDQLRDWLTAHGVPTAPIGADPDPTVASEAELCLLRGVTG